MPKLWPYELIRELLTRAELEGEAKATLTDPREAELFRFAIYSFRKTANIGEDLCVTLEENIVVVKKRILPEVVIQ